jgi:hypothetical protein
VRSIEWRFVARSIVVLGILLVFSGPRLAQAEERSAPLLSADDLLSGANITQGSTNTSAGSVLYPEQILTIDVSGVSQSGTDPRVQAWNKVYRFIVVPLNLAIRANPSKAPSSVIVNAAFRNTGQLPKQPIIIDIFPATGFKQQPFQGSASLGVGADLKFAGTLPANANASVEAALKYTYAPAFANVQSGYASSGSFWQFVATQAEQPVGQLPLKLTVGIPRTMTASSLSLAVDVTVNFGSSWWGDEIRTSFLTEVLLPQ